jgi:hypothetical protein
VVCRPIDEGGLDIKNLETQNICLLLKFIHKLHTSNNCSRAKWIQKMVYHDNKRLGDKISVCSNSWRYLMTLAQLYRDLTVVKIGNGCHTSFWLDSWLGNKPLLIQFPALFSHVQHPNMTVAESFIDLGWQLRFRHLTSQRVKNELTSLLNLINDVILNGEADERTMGFDPHKKNSVKACYYAMNFGGVTVLGNMDIWNSLAPKKCKIFAWLAFHDRLNTRERLAKRGIVSESLCPFSCNCNENLSHLLFSCPHTNMIWQKFLIPI